MWESICHNKVNLIPHHSDDPRYRDHLEKKIERHFNLQGPMVFLHINLMDNRSEFLSSLRVRVSKEDSRFVVNVWGAVAIANSIAYLSELLDPKTLVLGLTRRNLMRQSLEYALWGEGEIGLTVYSILVRYWEFTRQDTGVPLIYLMSD